MRKVGIGAMILVILLALGNAVTRGQGGRAGTAAQPAAPPAPKDKAAYFPNSDLQTIWKDIESRQVNNKRVLEGGTHSINVRIVREDAAPLIHGKSLDIWVVMTGTATAITGGQLIGVKPTAAGTDDQAGTSIQGGVEQNLGVGDILYVPQGIPHGFKNMKGFRALLIRFDTN